MYPGGKNGAGVYQTIINQLPKHELYVECFLGSGAVLRNKLPALCSIGIDSDADVLTAFAADYCRAGEAISNLTLVCANALPWLCDHRAEIDDARTLIYLDPPYLRETRSDQRRIYRHEFYTEAEHRDLLRVLKSFRGSRIAISGYASSLYAEELADWRTVSFQAHTRGGRMATEWLWLNYPEPLELHDYRYLGKDFRERERIKRKKTRWVERLRRMEGLERYALMEALEEFRKASSEMACSSRSPEMAMGSKDCPDTIAATDEGDHQEKNP